jgi:uncharacterized protein YjbJ (UPF0337 family)
MSLLDKILGRGKKAAGDVIDSPGLRREGAHQEAEGKAEERAEVHESAAAEARAEAAEHRQERETP